MACTATCSRWTSCAAGVAGSAAASAATAATPTNCPPAPTRATSVTPSARAARRRSSIRPAGISGRNVSTRAVMRAAAEFGGYAINSRSSRASACVNSPSNRCRLPGASREHTTAACAGSRARSSPADRSSDNPSMTPAARPGVSAAKTGDAEASGARSSIPAPSPVLQSSRSTATSSAWRRT